jgi:hypothetical protein
LPVDLRALAGYEDVNDAERLALYEMNDERQMRNLLS